MPFLTVGVLLTVLAALGIVGMVIWMIVRSGLTERAPGKGGIPLPFYAGRARPALPEHECSP